MCLLWKSLVICILDILIFNSGKFLNSLKTKLILDNLHYFLFSSSYSLFSCLEGYADSTIFTYSGLLVSICSVKNCFPITLFRALLFLIIKIMFVLEILENTIKLKEKDCYNFQSFFILFYFKHLFKCQGSKSEIT